MLFAIIIKNTFINHIKLIYPESSVKMQTLLVCVSIGPLPKLYCKSYVHLHKPK